MIQTNLREIDAGLDADALMAALRDFHADTLLFNVGGIVANYPTSLAFHCQNPHLYGRDLVGDIVSRCREAGIRFIGRFDFSKVNACIAVDHADWLYRSAAGEQVSYNDQVHTCINGPYQQRFSLEILREVLRRYPIDGVFFNMIGYVTSDYSGVEHGHCRCDNCITAFRRYSGMEIPYRMDPDDPASRQYALFKRDTSAELFHRIRDCVKQENPNAAICTYTHEGVDIVRSESNSGAHRHQPEWSYSASQNVKRVLGSWPNLAVSNATVHFIDFSYRHAAVAPLLSAVRAAQNLAHRGWLDFYVIGHLNNQDDRQGLEAVRRIFAYYARHEDLLGDLVSPARICLVEPAASRMVGGGSGYRGMFRLLSETHHIFDVMHDSVLDADDIEARLERYDLLILPDARVLSVRSRAALNQYVQRGGKLLCTGLIGQFDERGKAASLRDCPFLGVREAELRPQRVGSYFRVRRQDKHTLSGLDDLDIVFQDEQFLQCTATDEAASHLGFIPAHMFGPPEKAYYKDETEIPGLIVNQHGNGLCAFLPWTIAGQYGRFPAHGHRLLVQAVLREVLQAPQDLQVEASSLLDVSLLSDRQQRHEVIHLVNLAEQHTTQTEPSLVMREIPVACRCSREVVRVRTLAGDAELPFTQQGGLVRFVVPEVALLESVVIAYG